MAGRRSEMPKQRWSRQDRDRAEGSGDIGLQCCFVVFVCRLRPPSPLLPPPPPAHPAPPPHPPPLTPMRMAPHSYLLHAFGSRYEVCARLSLLPLHGVSPVSSSGGASQVGGIKEKVIAARREGVHTLILPRGNESDFHELKECPFAWAGGTRGGVARREVVWEASEFLIEARRASHQTSGHASCKSGRFCIRPVTVLGSTALSKSRSAKLHRCYPL